MAITVHSPHSGKPVKVRPQDVGRALRDERGRVFYVVPREDGSEGGSGYYAAKTRHGSAEELEAYDGLVAAGGAVLSAHTTADEGENAGPPDIDPAADHDPRIQAYDATGIGRPMPWLRGVVVIILLAAVILLVLYSCTTIFGESPAQGPGLPTPTPTVPGSPGPPSPQADVNPQAAARPWPPARGGESRGAIFSLAISSGRLEPFDFNPCPRTPWPVAA